MSSSRTVLAVDDQPDSLGLVRAYLEAAGYVVFLARSGEECLQLLARLKPRMILLDVQLPGIDGFATCREIRKRDDLADVPIAFLTVRKSGDDVRDCIAAGGNDFIAKPLDRHRLIERVAHWTRHRVVAAGPV